MVCGVPYRHVGRTPNAGQLPGQETPFCGWCASKQVPEAAVRVRPLLAESSTRQTGDPPHPTHSGTSGEGFDTKS